MKKIPKQVIDLTLAVLMEPSLHWKACFEDMGGRPDFNCVCPIKDIVDKILKLKEV